MSPPLHQPPAQVFRVQSQHFTNDRKRENIIGLFSEEPCLNFPEKSLSRGRLGAGVPLIYLYSLRQDGQHEGFFRHCELCPSAAFEKDQVSEYIRSAQNP
jgi:hypothetical protein